MTQFEKTNLEIIKQYKKEIRKAKKQIKGKNNSIEFQYEYAEVMEEKLNAELILQLKGEIKVLQDKIDNLTKLSGYLQELTA